MLSIVILKIQARNKALLSFSSRRFRNCYNVNMIITWSHNCCLSSFAPSTNSLFWRLGLFWKIMKFQCVFTYFFLDISPCLRYNFSSKIHLLVTLLSLYSYLRKHLQYEARDGWNRIFSIQWNRMIKFHNFLISSSFYSVCCYLSSMKTVLSRPSSVHILSFYGANFMFFYRAIYSFSGIIPYCAW